MTERDRQHDIQIADDRWIEFIDLAGRYEQAIDLDALLGELWPLIYRLETHCAAGCCGIDAYDFTREAVDAALAELDRAQMRDACAAARRAVTAADGDVLISATMNHYADKRVILQLLDHLDACIAARDSAGA
ncbi:hypothetical protein GCN74_25085 [Janthinobacterium sp. FT14W]|uniref:DUF6331 family protein n=1 Tax=Janthinobacterium sp. FT14W TaxID=2654253 RepID=UPI001264B267|nr:DUF6331 family protein [Janthinobacterium sp. FT14W]KAB8053804.1 hypothetical protein GCN74_25085 [Janthinobacterium sp. FT14W]